MMTTGQVVRDIGMHPPAEMTLLLGAGASKSSGVSLASEMIRRVAPGLVRAECRRRRSCRAHGKGMAEGEPCRYAWFEKDTEYSKLFEYRYGTPSARQRYIEQKIDRVRPGWGYLYLANIIVSARRFTTVFTTNFDDLINEALGSFLRQTPSSAMPIRKSIRSASERSGQDRQVARRLPLRRHPQYRGRAARTG